VEAVDLLKIGRYRDLPRSGAAARRRITFCEAPRLSASRMQSLAARARDDPEVGRASSRRRVLRRTPRALRMYSSATHLRRSTRLTPVTTRSRLSAMLERVLRSRRVIQPGRCALDRLLGGCKMRMSWPMHEAEHPRHRLVTSYEDVAGLSHRATPTSLDIDAIRHATNCRRARQPMRCSRGRGRDRDRRRRPRPSVNAGVFTLQQH